MLWLFLTCFDKKMQQLLLMNFFKSMEMLLQQCHFCMPCKSKYGQIANGVGALKHLKFTGVYFVVVLCS